MQVNDWQNVLGKDIPNMLKAAQKMDDSVAPLLAKINHNREEIEKQVDPALLRQFDSAMNDVKKAKAKMKKHGTFGSK